MVLTKKKKTIKNAHNLSFDQVNGLTLALDMASHNFYFYFPT